jgi:hypothetical protein
MNDWNSRFRVGDRLADLTREAEMGRRAHLGATPAPRFTSRVAGALRQAADRLDGAPGGARVTGTTSSVRHSADGPAGA